MHKVGLRAFKSPYICNGLRRVAVISAKNHKRQSVTTKREKSKTAEVLTAILTLPNLT